MIRDEIAWKLATKLFPHVPWAELYPPKQNICLELADALLPIVERVARNVRDEIVADIRDRRGLRQAWDDIDEEVREEIEATHAAIVRRVMEAGDERAAV